MIFGVKIGLCLHVTGMIFLAFFATILKHFDDVNFFVQFSRNAIGNEIAYA